MLGLQVRSLDGPDGVVLAELADPPDGVLVVDVHAAGVGFPDLLMSRGEFQIRQEPPFTLGWEAAGVVADAPGSSPFRRGDRVVTLTLGSYAERLAAVPEATFTLPGGLSFAEGAAYPLNYLTALAGLDRRGRLQAGERVLVLGAGGGAGSAAVQVAKGLGAWVVALVSSEDKGEVARASGADETVLAGDDWRARILELSDGGVDLVFDPVGGDRFHEALRCLAPEGRLVVIGFAAGAIPEVAVNRLLLRNVDVRGCTWSVLAGAPGGLPAAAQRLAVLVGDGFVRPPVGAEYELADGAEALRALAGRRSLGKVILNVR